MAKLSTFYLKDYDGGLNDTSSPRQIERNEASILQNWHIRTKGQLTRRDGLLQVGSTLTNSAGGLHGYFRSNGGKDLLVMDGGTLKYLNTTTFDALDSGFTSGKPFWLETCPLNDKVYIANEDNTTHAWDRASTTLNSSLSDLGTTKYQANVLRWHKNHMFFLNNLTLNTTTYPHSIAWSAMGDPETHDTTNDRIDIPGGGRVITAVDQGNVLVIFKERAIQFLDGWGSNSWRITSSSSNVANFDEQVGCIAPRGACRVGNEVWFIDDEGQIRRIYQTDFDAFRRDIVSTKIQGTLAGINKAQLSKAVMWSNNDYVYCALPNGSDTENSIVLCFDLITSKRSGGEAWEVITGWTPSLMTDYIPSSTPELYLADSQSGKIYLHTGDDDDGVAIDADWTGKEDDYDRPERFKRYKFGYLTGMSGAGDMDVTVHASIDGAGFAKLSTLNLLAAGTKLGPTGSATMGPTGEFVLGGNRYREDKFYYSGGGGAVRGKIVRHSIRHHALNETPIVNTFTSHYKERGLR